LVSLPTKRKQKHGFWQPADLVHGLPQAGKVLAVVCSWRAETALAERTAANIAANNIFFTMNSSLFLFHFGSEGAGPSGWQTPLGFVSVRPKQ